MDNFDLRKYLVENKRTRVSEGTYRSTEGYTSDIANFKGGIAYSLKNHEDRKYDISHALGVKFGFQGKGGTLMQRSHGKKFDTVWLGPNKEEAQKVSDWLKSQGAETVLFGSKVTGFKGSNLDYIDRFLNEVRFKKDTTPTSTTF